MGQTRDRIRLLVKQVRRRQRALEEERPTPKVRIKAEGLWVGYVGLDVAIDQC